MADFHFIGILGSGMNVVAQLLLAQGHTISGSDREANAYLEPLREMGMEISIGQRAENVEGAGHVVYSSAIRESNPEMVRARELGIPVLHRSQALKLAAGEHRFAAVAGTHGKTTTSGMLASLLEECGREPSWAVGSVIKRYHTGGHVGKGDIFVAESDESDGSFLNYEPTLELITNVEADHLNYYGTFEKIIEAFEQFVSNIKPGGALVVFGDDPHAAALLARTRDDVAGYSYGCGEHCDVRITSIEDLGVSQRASIDSPWGNFDFELHMIGEHNVWNMTGAWTAAVALGADPQKAADAIATFQGTKRRFELVETIELEPGQPPVRVYDDYAHHPAEISMAVKQALHATQGRVILAFEPLLYSRTEDFQREFAAAMEPADETYILDICAAREDERDDVTAATIGQHMSACHYPGSQAATPAQIAPIVRPGDLVMTMGCGNVGPLARGIAKAISERASR